MATQICPKCKSDTFTWSVDEEVTLLTRWGCNECGYTAFEDEQLASKYCSCGVFGAIQLQDSLEKYWWCSNCNKITEEHTAISPG